MPQDLPQYDPTSSLRPTPAPNVQGSYQAFANSLDNFSQKLMAQRGKLINYKAAKQGAMAGESPDFKGKLATPINDATRIYDQAALASNKGQILFNVKDGVSKLKNTILSPTNFTLGANPIETYDKEFQQFSENTLANAPPENKVAAQNYLNMYGTLAKAAVVNKTNTLNLNTLSAYHKSLLGALKDSSYNLAFNGLHENADAVLGQAHQFQELAVETNLISADQAADDKRSWIAALQNREIIGKFSRDLEAGHGEQFLEDYRKKKFPELSTEQRLQMNMQVEGMAQLHKQTNDVRGRNLESELQDQSIAIQQGQPQDSDLLSRLKGLNPAQAAEWEQKFTRAKLVNTAATQLRFLNPLQRQHALVALSDVATQVAPYQRKGLINHMVTLSQQQMKTYNNDKANYVMENPAVQSAIAAHEIALKAQMENAEPIIMSNGQINVQRALQPALDPAKVAPYNVDRFRAMINVEKEMGTPDDDTSIIPKMHAAALVHEIDTFTPENKISALQNILDEYGSHTTVAMRDLNKAGLPKAYQMILSASNNPNSRSQVPTMMIAADLSNKDMETVLKSSFATSGKKMSDMDDAINSDLSGYDNSLKGYNGPTIDTQNDIKGYVKKLAAVYISKGVSMEKSVKDASNYAINNNYSYVSQPNGVSLRAAPNMTSGQVIDALRAMQFSASNSDLAVPQAIKRNFSTLPPYIAEQQYKNLVSNTTSFVSNNASNGYILVDDAGNPILTKSGQPFTVSYAEMNDVNSKLHKLIQETPNLPGTENALDKTPFNAFGQAFTLG